jgi:ATP-binding cassette subfamily B protein
MTTAEDDVVKGLDLKLVRQLFATLKPYTGAVLISLAALLISASAELGVPVLLQNGIDKGVLAGDLPHLTLICGSILGLLIVGMLASFAQVYLLSRVTQDVMKDLRTRLFAHIQRQSSRWLYNHPVGKLVSGVTSDVATMSDFFNTLFTSLLRDLLVMLGVVGALFALNAPLAAFTVASLPPVILLVAFFRYWSRGAYRQVRARVSRVNAFLSEHLQGISVVQLFGQEHSSRRKFAAENDGLLHANLTEMMVNAVFRPLIDVLAAVTLGCLLWFGTGLTLQHAVTAGTLIAFINLVGRFYNPVGSLAENFTALQSAMAGAERVFGTLEDRQHVPDDGIRTLEGVGGAIRFEDVHFRYLPDEPVLRGLNFVAEEGQTVAIVGYTGAGKTTVTSLLTRLWDIDQGRILFGGTDLREFTLASLRGGIQSVLQDVFLFTGTIYENIDLGRGLPRERIEEVCRAVQAHAFIEKLPDGYQTKLSEGATNLSAGQRQLVSFARVLAQDPRVLILDEATANIDTETEVLIQKALTTLLAGRTSLVIAHRLSTIRRAHRILVLDQGRVAESGTHDELMEKKGFYYNLYKLQYEKKAAATT